MSLITISEGAPCVLGDGSRGMVKVILPRPLLNLERVVFRAPTNGWLSPDQTLRRLPGGLRQQVARRFVAAFLVREPFRLNQRPPNQRHRPLPGRGVTGRLGNLRHPSANASDPKLSFIMSDSTMQACVLGIDPCQDLPGAPALQGRDDAE